MEANVRANRMDCWKSQFESVQGVELPRIGTLALFLVYALAVRQQSAVEDILCRRWTERCQLNIQLEQLSHKERKQNEIRVGVGNLGKLRKMTYPLGSPRLEFVAEHGHSKCDVARNGSDKGSL